MTIKELAYRFFDNDVDYCKQVKLTKEEINLFEKMEWAILYDNGLKNINGGWSNIAIYEEEEDLETDNAILHCWASCGVCDENGKDVHEWKVIFNRTTKQFEEY